MKFSFKLGSSSTSNGGDEFNGSCSNKQSGGLIVGGVRQGGKCGVATSSSTMTELGFVKANDIIDKSLRGVTAITAMAGGQGFIEREEMTKDSKKRQRSELVIECKKKLRTDDQPPSDEDDTNLENNYNEFSRDLEVIKGGLIINKARRNRIKAADSSKVTAPLLVRMNRDKNEIATPVKQEATPTTRTMTIIKVEADIVSTSTTTVDNSNIERLIKPPLGSNHKPDFSKVKVEDFGLAMLKGMGYNPDDTAGKKRSKNLEFKVRAYVRGGLGSDRFLKGKKEGEPDVTKNPEDPDRSSDEDDEENSSTSSSDD